eukprot:6209560-Pleurochrysis_carterae.AAC.2
MRSSAQPVRGMHDMDAFHNANGKPAVAPWAQHRPTTRRLLVQRPLCASRIRDACWRGGGRAAEHRGRRHDRERDVALGYHRRQRKGEHRDPAARARLAQHASSKPTITPALALALAPPRCSQLQERATEVLLLPPLPCRPQTCAH